MKDLKFDHAKRDYVEDGAGGMATTEAADSSLHHQIHIPKGSFWADGEAGSRLHELARAKNSLKTPQVIANMFDELAAPLVAAGRITRPVSTLERQVDRVVGDVTSEDLSTGEELALSNLLPVSP